ncbi:craniofacial development protein 2-like [Plakobranchus ocellatus]|uniref:Craniofacial development protein 2-like n=1 Tax=Plakobranchus ocellatus TaxID=259542 RepID=A0AAV4BFT7_9GAST|nr:craniofacial development protein 2-like [Plakobranchus ocellatus]
MKAKQPAKKDELLEIRTYYEQLYKEEKTDKDMIKRAKCFMTYLKVPQLNAEQIDANKEDFSEGEILTALKFMNNGSVPGPDGIPVEFYKLFWLDIKEIFMEFYFIAAPKTNYVYHKDKVLSP